MSRQTRGQTAASLPTGAPHPFKQHTLTFDAAWDLGGWRAVVLRARDGDTFELLVDRGHRIYTGLTVRLPNADAPEIRGKDKAKGLRVMDAVLRDLADCHYCVWVGRGDRMSFDRHVLEMARAHPSQANTLISIAQFVTALTDKERAS